MPSPWHDTLTQLVQDRPDLVAEIFDFLGKPLPPGAAIQFAPAALNDRPSYDLHPDNVFIVGPAGCPAQVVVDPGPHPGHHRPSGNRPAARRGRFVGDGPPGPLGNRGVLDRAGFPAAR